MGDGAGAGGAAGGGRQEAPPLQAARMMGAGAVGGRKTFMTGWAPAESADSTPLAFFFSSERSTKRFYAASRVFFFFSFPNASRANAVPSLALRSLFSRARDDGP